MNLDREVVSGAVKSEYDFPGFPARWLRETRVGVPHLLWGSHDETETTSPAGLRARGTAGSYGSDRRYAVPQPVSMLKSIALAINRFTWDHHLHASERYVLRPVYIECDGGEWKLLMWELALQLRCWNCRAWRYESEGTCRCLS